MLWTTSILFLNLGQFLIFDFWGGLMLYNISKNAFNVKFFPVSIPLRYLFYLLFFFYLLSSILFFLSQLLFSFVSVSLPSPSASVSRFMVPPMAAVWILQGAAIPFKTPFTFNSNLTNRAITFCFHFHVCCSMSFLDDSLYDITRVHCRGTRKRYNICFMFVHKLSN